MTTTDDDARAEELLEAIQALNSLSDGGLDSTQHYRAYSTVSDALLRFYREGKQQPTTTTTRHDDQP